MRLSPLAQSDPRLLFALGLAGAVICVFLWSGWFVLSRDGLTSGIGIIDLMFLRYGTAMIAVLPFAWKFWPRQISWRDQLILALTAAGLPYALFSFAGLKTVSVAEAGIFQTGFLPIFTALLVLMLDGKKPTAKTLIGIAVILIGSIALSLKNESQLFFAHFGRGHIYLLITAAILSFYTVILPRSGITPSQIIVIVPTINGVLATGLWIFFGNKNLWDIGVSPLLFQSLYQGLGPSLLGVFGYFLAINYIGKTETSSIMAGIPALAALIAIPALGEQPGLWGWLGIVTVSIGILLIVRNAPKKV